LPVFVPDRVWWTVLRVVVSLLRETPMSADTTDRTVRFWMDSVATLAALSGLVVLAWMNWGRIFPPPPVLPDAPVSLAGATLRGDTSAPVVLIEYSDYLCPFCLRFEEDVLPALQQRYNEEEQEIRFCVCTPCSG